MMPEEDRKLTECFDVLHEFVRKNLPAGYELTITWIAAGDDVEASMALTDVDGEDVHFDCEHNEAAIRSACDAAAYDKARSE